MIKKNKKNSTGLVLKLDEEFEIRADSKQFILKQGKSDYTFFGTLANIFREIFDLKIKSNLVNSDKKDIQEILKTYKETEKWIKSFFKDIENPDLKI